MNPSEAVLVGVANALQCSPLETRHLFVLAGLTRRKPPVTVCEGISHGTRRMLDSLMPQPASIQKPNFDIVAWNDSFCRLMGIDFATLPEEDRNCIYLYLTHETAQPDRKSRCAADLRLLFPRRDGRAPRRSGVGKQTGALFRRLVGV